MSGNRSRFTNLVQAVREGTEPPETLVTSEAVTPAPAASPHKPAVALAGVGEALKNRVARLQAEVDAANTANTDLQRELERARAASARAGSDIEEFHYLDPTSIVDLLPKDRLRGGFAGDDFQELLSDIEVNGQNDAITVRRTQSGVHEIASGRRRLEVCRQLGRAVLARVRDLDEASMLRVQFSENERRADISALERARWFAEVRQRLAGPAKDLATRFGVDQSTLSLYLRLARFPDEILSRLQDPRRLAVLPARRVMEAIESDPHALRRILDALDAHNPNGDRRPNDIDATGQIEVLLRAAEGKAVLRSGSRLPVPERRVIVHEGRRIGTLTRNGGQWVFRFATSIPDHTVQLLAERLAAPVIEEAVEGATPFGSAAGRH